MPLATLVLAMSSSLFEDALSHFSFHGLFGRCGEAVDDAHSVPGWRSALEFAESEVWDDFVLDRANAIRLWVRPISVERFGCWGDFSVPAGARWDSIQDAVRSRSPVDDGIWTRTLPTVEWILVHAAVEEAYADLDCPDWHRRMLKWLCDGHFPCGWDGEYPAGSPVVY